MAATRAVHRVEGAALAGVAVVFFLSGASALVYQVAWQRILAFHTGVGIQSIALIVAAFMAGLGIGSHVGGRLSARVVPRRALGIFATLELGLAVFGSLSCAVYYDWLYVRAAWLYQTTWRAGLLHFAALLVPTTLMGMSLPFLVRAMVRDAPTAGRTIGFLYGVNVLGASAGALLTPWVLIRLTGIRGAVLAAAAGNAVAGVGALALGGLLARAWASPIASPRGADASEPASGTPTEPPASRAFLLWLVLYGASGFCALSLEMLWFRVTNVAVKATAFTFGTVLAFYLFAMGLGSLTGGLLARRIRRPLLAFLVVQSTLLAYAGAALWALVTLPPDAPLYGWFVRFFGQSFGFALGRQWDLAGLLRLYLLLPAALFGPPTFMMGLSFTILQRAVQDDPESSGRKVGSLQAANIVGCVAGCLLVGLVALDGLGTTGTMRALMVCGVGYAVLAILTHGPRPALVALAIASGALAVGLPGREGLWQRLHGSTPAEAHVGEDATGVSAIVRAIRPSGRERWRVFVDGRSHSWLPFGGVHSRLGGAPAIVHPRPEDVAIIGLGSGDTAWAAACRRETKGVTVFEISGPQPRLLRRLAEAGHPELDRLGSFLNDPRVQIRIRDGRNSLLRESRRYDIIQADPLSPDMAMSGNLYSVEYFRLCLSRLKPGGLMCVWTPTIRVRRTFRRAFPHVLMLEEDRIAIGSNEPIPFDIAAWRARLAGAEVQQYLGLETSLSLLANLETATMLGPVEGADRMGLNDDLFPRDEFLSP